MLRSMPSESVRRVVPPPGLHWSITSYAANHIGQHNIISSRISQVAIADHERDARANRDMAGLR